jgi:transposase
MAADEHDRGGRATLSNDERAELKRLREENRILRMERDFAKKAAVFFAKESK